jgi:lipoyl-dependent peroxiredoxin subunit D
MSLQAIEQRLPEAAKDLKLNLQSVLSSGSLSVSQRFGVAVACAHAARNAELRDALVESARAQQVPDAVLDDALAAAALMGMNNVFYRFRHFIGKEVYAQKPARLRMNRLVKPAADRTDFELYCLAVSAINGCETCVVAHEKTVVGGGLTEDHVHDAVRIAATVQGAAVALEAADTAAPASAAAE